MRGGRTQNVNVRAGDGATLLAARPAKASAKELLKDVKGVAGSSAKAGAEPPKAAGSTPEGVAPRALAPEHVVLLPLLRIPQRLVRVADLLEALLGVLLLVDVRVVLFGQLVVARGD